MNLNVANAGTHNSGGNNTNSSSSIAGTGTGNICNANNIHTGATGVLKAQLQAGSMAGTASEGSGTGTANMMGMGNLGSRQVNDT